MIFEEKIRDFRWYCTYNNKYTFSDTIKENSGGKIGSNGDIHDELNDISGKHDTDCSTL